MLKRVIAFILVLALLVPVGSALAVKYYRVNTSSLNAHEKASVSSKVVASYRRDYAVTIAKKYAGGSVEQDDLVSIGAIGLIIVCVLPFVFNGLFKANVSFGGTSLIIIVSVILETMQQIETMMLERNYKGFLNS